MMTWSLNKFNFVELSKMKMTFFWEEYSCWMTLFLLMMNDPDLILMAISRLDIDIKMIDNDACMSVQNISYIYIPVLIAVCSWPVQPMLYFISELIVTNTITWTVTLRKSLPLIIRAGPVGPTILILRCWHVIRKSPLQIPISSFHFRCNPF